MQNQSDQDIPPRDPLSRETPIKEQHVPVPLYEYEPVVLGRNNEMSNRLLILCLVSIPMPGLGHYLLGCDVNRCSWMCVKYILLMILWMILWCLVFILPALVFPPFILLVCPLAFWGAYPWLIEDLKKEYRNRINK